MVSADIAGAREAARAAGARLTAVARSSQAVVPEIHDRLRLVRSNEALIFVSPQPASQESFRVAVERDRPVQASSSTSTRTVRRSGWRAETWPSPSPAEVQTHRDQYQRSLLGRKHLAFEVRREGKRPSAVSLAPQIHDERLEDQMGTAYLKSTEEWEPGNSVPAAERHFLRKKRRAALFAVEHR